MNTNTDKSVYKAITAQQAKQLICNLSCYTVILDVRREEEYKLGHIRNAVNLPLSQLEERVKTVIPDLSQEIIVYCRTGSRSIDAANRLLAMGYDKVYDLGSINNWCYGMEI